MAPRPCLQSTHQQPDKIQTYTMDEVAKHHTPDDCWVVVSDKVYDLTRWSRHHPGGSQVLFSLAGSDVSDAYLNTHAESKKAADRLQSFCIGQVAMDTKKTDQLEQDQKELADLLITEGLYRTDYLWYAFTLARIFVLLPASIFCVVSSDNWWVELLGACLMALFFQQLAFIGHDAGHNAISHVRMVDEFIGLFVGNLFTGVSIGWWKNTHNTHHILTNSCDYDPDIQHLPVLAVSTKLFASLYSHYHKQIMSYDSLAQTLVRYQHISFWPVMAFARFNLYLQSVYYVLFRSRKDFRLYEMTALVIFWVWFGWVLSRCNAPWMFLLVSHALAGVLHVQICISHFAMETYLGPHYSTIREDFFRRQLATSMNLEASNWSHWFYGGLEFQIEHHLYPRIPRHNLGKVKPLVERLCKKHNIKYHSVGWFKAVAETVKALKQVAKQAGNKDTRIKESMLWQGLNAFG